MKRKCSSKYRRFKRLAKEKLPWVCAYCEKHLEKHELTIDHLTPVSRGGEICSIDNVTISCRPCNEEKNDLDYLEFISRKKAS